MSDTDADTDTDAPHRLARGVRTLTGGGLGVLIGVSLVRSSRRAGRQIDGSQFADSTAGAAEYALTVGVRALVTPPLEYLTLGLVVTVVVALVGGLLAVWLETALMEGRN